MLHGKIAFMQSLREVTSRGQDFSAQHAQGGTSGFVSHERKRAVESARSAPPMTLGQLDPSEIDERGKKTRIKLQSLPEITRSGGKIVESAIFGGPTPEHVRTRAHRFHPSRKHLDNVFRTVVGGGAKRQKGESKKNKGRAGTTDNHGSMTKSRCVGKRHLIGHWALAIHC
jgi:hypothetical protein